MFLKNGFENEINPLELLKCVPKNEARFQKCQNFKTNSERELSQLENFLPKKEK